MKISINADNQYTETEIVINCPRINDDIEKLLAIVRKLDMKLTGRKDRKQYTIEADNIMYIESTDKRAFIYTIDNIFESSFRLFELEEKLADGDFIRISKTCLVNINYIKSIEPDLGRRLILTVEKGIKLVVSRLYSSTIKQKLEEYNE